MLYLVLFVFLINSLSGIFILLVSYGLFPTNHVFMRLALDLIILLKHFLLIKLSNNINEFYWGFCLGEIFERYVNI